MPEDDNELAMLAQPGLAVHMASQSSMPDQSGSVADLFLTIWTFKSAACQHHYLRFAQTITE
ncbi:hypothetical protein MUK42_20374 [Musa troglodytarum]|uniref:Uncharacterized protein n=1 Tax=Musa troglodytarum TaxID=320322 RepID=A0A9E7JZR5_9LILI|nr:hypothetical protein MUK42_20374 [Musa troglodytarum]